MEIPDTESPNLADLAAEVTHIEDAFAMAAECGFADLAAEIQRHIRDEVLPNFEILLCLADERDRAELCIKYQRLRRLVVAENSPAGGAA
jgi:hypothetical protein